MSDRYYDIYVNKIGNLTPCNFLGTVKVIGEINDKLINSWCNLKLGPKFSLNNHKLIEMWRFMFINDINDNLITTIQRKSS